MSGQVNILQRPAKMSVFGIFLHETRLRLKLGEVAVKSSALRVEGLGHAQLIGQCSNLAPCTLRVPGPWMSYSL